jgi:transcriptional regulator GlxA family with amidase domain
MGAIFAPPRGSRLTFRAACLTFCDVAKDQTSTQTVGFLLVPGFALMSYTATVEPLRAANLISGKPLYRWWNAAPGGKPVMASNGLAIIPDCGTNTERDANMVFVCAGGNPALFDDKSVFAWLRRLARKGVIIGGISGGPYVLAKAGLLDQRRATLHWEHLPAFREAFPDVAVVPSLFEIDGNRITCSGGISALDMMVALIERDHGRQLAAMETSIETPQPRAALARQAGISLRQLERLFHRHIGHGVHFHYRWLRLERARQLLRETTLPVLDVALATGFASASQFARAYARAFGEPPSRTRLSG